MEQVLEKPETSERRQMLRQMRGFSRFMDAFRAGDTPWNWPAPQCPDELAGWNIARKVACRRNRLTMTFYGTDRRAGHAGSNEACFNYLSELEG